MNACVFCGHEDRNNYFCTNCGKILAANWGNYFLAFELPLVLDVDLKELKTSYYQKLTSLHPDKFLKASSKEKELAQEQSAFLNTAYKTLGDVFLRTEHLLKILGPQESMPGVMDGDFLMKMMSWREQLEENEAAFLGSLEVKLNELENQLLGEIKISLSADDVKKAHSLLAKWRFAKRFIGDLQAI